MTERPRSRPDIAIVGATASGKTALALALAAALGDVELVSVDALAVYRCLDIGTAKPGPDERAAARWHLIDLVEPEVEFSVAEFQVAARAALRTIAAAGHRAVLVGGTGLYHRAIIDDLALPGRYPEIATALEEEARQVGSAALHARLAGLDPLAAARILPSNTRRIVRALEVTLGSGRPFSASGPGLEAYPPSRFVQIGLALERAELDRRIAQRLEGQLAAGWLEEVAGLGARPGGLSRTAAVALGYGELAAHLAGRLTLDEARAEILRRTRAFARRQESWFRRDPRVHWLPAGAPDLCVRALALIDAAPGVPGSPQANAVGGGDARMTPWH